jgi:hypothetical protein
MPKTDKTVEVINIIPMNDWVEHTEDGQCICRPRIECENGTMLIIHDAADGRL